MLVLRQLSDSQTPKPKAESPRRRRWFVNSTFLTLLTWLTLLTLLYLPTTVALELSCSQGQGLCPNRLRPQLPRHQNHLPQASRSLRFLPYRQPSLQLSILILMYCAQTSPFRAMDMADVLLSNLRLTPIGAIARPVQSLTRHHSRDECPHLHRLRKYQYRHICVS